MRLSIGTGIGPLRVSQTIARSGRRNRRPSARQDVAVGLVKLVGHVALAPRLFMPARDDALDRRAWELFNAGELSLSGVLLVMMRVASIRQS